MSGDNNRHNLRSSVQKQDPDSICYAHVDITKKDEKRLETRGIVDMANTKFYFHTENNNSLFML